VLNLSDDGRVVGIEIEHASQKTDFEIAARRQLPGEVHAVGWRSALIFNAESLMSSSNKVVLAYSGELDTSVILKCCKIPYQCEVVTFTAISAKAKNSNRRAPKLNNSV